MKTAMSALFGRLMINAMMDPAFASAPVLAGARMSASPRDARKVYRDRSKYTGAMLREIRAERGCGRPPNVLAARRAKALAALRVDDATRPE